ncbi:glycoside hydrolase family 43 protein [Fulvivirga sediminis]|uniref:Glycoside hydrolase family 43 protein n=1 Tax=Fulvivirga sediminis TaxID=2803949 RepID=A0A937F8P9_9BACT|nr:glycoside hydrolase family 43 protein [Fulvivirga sediminis]MBL3657226.1 glycoside hydrolase family 43 protein [Fulvivirga sediminis]
MFKLPSIRNLLLTCSLIPCILSCSSKLDGKQSKGPEKKDKSVAYFDSFNYKGNDNFYNENPLPGKDYFYNPILPGWYSDPSICANGKDYFLVTSSFSYFPGVPIFHSQDLVNWKQIGHVLNRPSQLPLEGQHTSEGIFAPAISYNPHNQTYYMITTNIRKGNFFVKTKDPFGEWSEPVWLPEVKGIDPSFFFDDDGKAYIVNNDEPEEGSTYSGHRAIRVQQFDVETEKTFGSRKVLINGGVDISEKPVWIEGPHIYKIKGQYFLMCAEGGTSVNHREVIFKGDSPMGSFKPWDKNPILTQKHLNPSRKKPITCAGHADLVQKPNGEWWSVFLGCRPINNEFENLGRETFLMPVKWSEDGYPYLTHDNEEVPRVVQMNGLQRSEQPTFGNFNKLESFESPELNQEWFTMRGKALQYYSLTKTPGYLALQCAPVASTEKKELAFIARRIQHHQFEINSTVYFKPATEKDAAGLLLYKDERHQYFLAIQQENNQRKVALKKISDKGIEEISSKMITPTNDQVDLKITSNGTHFNFYCTTDGEKWENIAENISAQYLSTANSFGFTGTTVGMYATNSM